MHSMKKAMAQIVAGVGSLESIPCTLKHIRAPSATRPCRTVHNAAGNYVCSSRNVTSLE